MLQSAGNPKLCSLLPLPLGEEHHGAELSVVKVQDQDLSLPNTDATVQSITVLLGYDQADNCPRWGFPDEGFSKLSQIKLN